MAALNDKQATFVREYLIDLNATQAAIRAGYSEKTAASQGERLLRNVEVAAAIQEAMDKRSERTEIDADWVLKRWAKIVEADPNELIQYRRGACPSCAGVEPAEDAQGAHGHGGSLKRSKAPREAPAGDPNPDCPVCHGEGAGRVWVADTRKLSPEAKAIYAGVKIGKDGLQVLMHDQPAALVNVARHLGMFKERVEHSGEINIGIGGVSGILAAVKNAKAAAVDDGSN